MALAPVVICGMVWCVRGSCPGHGGAPVASAATGSDGFCCHYPGHCKDWVCIHLTRHIHTHQSFSPHLQRMHKESPSNPQEMLTCSTCLGRDYMTCTARVLSMFRLRLHDLCCKMLDSARFFKRIMHPRNAIGQIIPICTPQT